MTEPRRCDMCGRQIEWMERCLWWPPRQQIYCRTCGGPVWEDYCLVVDIHAPGYSDGD